MKAFPAFGVLLRRSSERKAIEGILLANSNLPGPRGNIELAQSFARTLAGVRLESWHWSMLSAWLATSAGGACELPQEYLPFCAALAFGVLYRPCRARAGGAPWPGSSRRPATPVENTRSRGHGPAGHRRGRPETLKQIVSKWMPGAGLLERRAIAAALAHPPLLGDSSFALFCLSTGMRSWRAWRGRQERAAAGGVPRAAPGTGLRLSVYVAGLPEAGFPLLAKWAAVQDKDVQWILRENVKKTRLAERHPGQTAALAKSLSEGRAAGR